MAYIKVTKTPTYFSRFQVQFRRRRQCKTDYYARKRLVWVDKNKYDAPKYRLVVRFSNKDVICSVIASDLAGDRVVQTAYGHELTKYGVKFGFNSWPATYATGLLVARRVNAALKLPYLGSKDAVNSYYNIGDEGEFTDDSGVEVTRRPFKAVLDVGLHRTTTGARIFAAVKGACDGGINVPHSPSRFVGTPKEKGAETDFEVVRKYIFGGHIAEYMDLLEAEDEEKFASLFSVAAKNGIKGKDIEGIWQSVHDKIRAETAEGLTAKNQHPLKKGFFGVRATAKDPKATFPKKSFQKAPLSVQQRKAKIFTKLEIRDARIAAKKAEIAALAAAAAAAEAGVEASESGSDSDE